MEAREVLDRPRVLVHLRLHRREVLGRRSCSSMRIDFSLSAQPRLRSSARCQPSSRRLALVVRHARLVASRASSPISATCDERQQVRADPRQQRGAERRRLGHLGDGDRDAEHVGLELHQPAVDRRGAVGAQLGERLAAGAVHRPHGVDGLVGHRLQRGAREVRAAAAAGEPDDRPARVRVPVRRAEPGQRGDEVDAVVGVQRGRQLLGLGRRGDDPEPVAQPLDRGAGDEDRRLVRVGGRAADLPRDRGQQPLLGLRHRGARVGEHERAGAVGVLAQAGLQAALAEQRRLLVAGHAGDRHLEAVELVRAGRAEHAAARPDLGQRALGDAAEELAAAPGPRRPWRCPSAACARRWRAPSTCSPVSLKSIHESTVPNTARPSRARSASPSTLRSSHSILVAEKYGSSISPVRSRMRSSSPASRSSSQRAGGAAVLPDERVVQRLARRRVPADDGLALVGDADGLELAGLAAPRRRAPRRRPRARPPRSPPRRARPSPASGSAG